MSERVVGKGDLLLLTLGALLSAFWHFLLGFILLQAVVSALADPATLLYCTTLFKRIQKCCVYIYVYAIGVAEQ